jgi:hypothetical protein
MEAAILSGVDRSSALRQLALIAVLSVALGLFVQLLILAAKLAAGRGFPGMVLVADITQGVTWSLLVCTGVAIATAMLRLRAAFSGLLSAIVAPLSLALAKALQRLVAGALDLVEQPAALSLATVSVARAVEYGVLGFLLGTLVQRQEQRFSRFAGAGAVVGIVLGGAVVGLSVWIAAGAGTPLSAAAIATGVVNEMVFPIGCGIVVYAGLLAGKSFSRAELTLA